jgi:hypothetical protein
MSSDEEKTLVARTLKAAVPDLETHKRTLKINSHALERLITHATDSLALLLFEADRLARRRRGDDIQSGDVEQAKINLEGRSRGNYWGVAIGCALGGAGIQGLADALLSHKGWAFIVAYSAAIVIGLLALYFGAPER